MRRDSMVSRPHSPQDEFVVTWRRSASSRSSVSADPAMVALTMFSGCSADGSVQVLDGTEIVRRD